MILMASSVGLVDLEDKNNTQQEAIMEERCPIRGEKELLCPVCKSKLRIREPITYKCTKCDYEIDQVYGNYLVDDKIIKTLEAENKKLIAFKEKVERILEKQQFPITVSDISEGVVYVSDFNEALKKVKEV